LDSLSRLSLLDLSANRIERILSLKHLGALRVLRVSSNKFVSSGRYHRSEEPSEPAPLVGQKQPILRLCRPLRSHYFPSPVPSHRRGISVTESGK
jgi:hypothetical protein